MRMTARDIMGSLSEKEFEAFMKVAKGKEEPKLQIQIAINKSGKSSSLVKAIADCISGCCMSFRT